MSNSGRYLTLALISFVLSAGIAEGGDSKFLKKHDYGIESNKRLMKECRHFKDSFLRHTCKNIARNPVFNSSEVEASVLYRDFEQDSGMVNTILALAPGLDAPPALPKLPLQDLKLGGDSEFDLTIQSRQLPPEKEKCLKYRKPTRGERKNERSISPWELVVDIDSNRFPQRIQFAECLCIGCINVNSNEENLNLASEPITTKEIVIVKNSKEINFAECTRKTCERKVIDIPVGCHCTVPKIVTGK